MLRTLLQLTTAIAIVITLFASPVARAETGSTIAKQVIMIDHDTGTVLFEKAADEKMPTSSMSKVMTMYVVFQAIKDGRLTLDTTLPVSEKAWRMGGSKMFVEVGNQVKVEDLIRGVVVQSGNDATIVLAEGLAGSEEAFAEALNAKAKELGMNGSHFMNASGWPDPEHYSTARDLATLAARTIEDFPDHYAYYGETEFTYNNIRQPNRNPLLYRNVGADGIKTGHTEAGGYGLMASGTREGRRVILVINGLPDEKARAEESARLLEWGLKAFINVDLYKAGDTVDKAQVVMGKVAEVPLAIERDLAVTVPFAVKNDLKVQVQYDAPLQAPLQKGQKVGTLKVEVPRAPALEVPLVVAENVEPLGFFAGTVAKAKLLLGGNKAGAE